MSEQAAQPRRAIRVVFNPNSGSKAGVATNSTPEADVRRAMADHGLGDDLVATASEEDAVAATREAVARGDAVVVAAGGDGTVGTVAGELLGTPTALGVLPLGSVMNVARMLDIPRDLDAATAVLARGQIRAIDIGEANGQLFLEAGSVGLTAAVFRESQHIDGGDYRAMLGMVRQLLRYQPSQMRIEIDDCLVKTRALAVVVANGPYTGLGYTVAPDARLDDGLLDVRVFRRFSRWELVRHFGAIAFGRRRYEPKVATFRAARVRIEGRRPLPCRADAIDLGTTPVLYTIRPGALKVVVPSPPS